MPSVDSWMELLPYRANELDIEGSAYRYLDEGQGAPILMSHGNPTWSFYWRRLVDAFRDTHRTLAVDHMGCGRSDRPQDADYRLERHIDNLVELIDRLDLRDITLVAHDWGGAIGLGAARLRPDRFARFVLLNTAAFPPPYVPLRIRACRIPLLGEWAMRRLNLFALAALWMAVERRSSLDAPARTGLVAPYDSWANRIAIARFVQDIPLTPRHSTWRLLEEIEASLEALLQRPTAMIWGMRDWCFRPECLDRLLSKCPHATVVRFHDVGHYVMEEAPDRVIDAMRTFLEQSSATTPPPASEPTP